MAETEEELNSLLMKEKKESEKLGLKLNIQSTKIMASSPIIFWEIDEETMETMRDFILGVSRYADDTILMAESEEELKSLLMKVKVE